MIISGKSAPCSMPFWVLASLRPISLQMQWPKASADTTTGAVADAGCMTEQTAANKLIIVGSTQKTDLCWQQCPHVGLSLQQ